VLRNLDLQVPAGSLYGFLGPNGAGKTTTLRLVLGLLKRQEGSIQLFGQALERHRIELLRRIGSSIESPSLYAHLSAAENLAIWQRAFRGQPRRIPEVLHQVGLGEAGSKPAGAFSLGMKQRLSLAVALLHQPELLILDEPTNGLDPHGIQEMRDLLRTLNRDHGTTILVSSHLLSEVERLVTHVGVIHRGVLKFQGSLSAFTERRGAAAPFTLDTGDNPGALALLLEDGWKARLEQEKILLEAVSRLQAGAINQRLVSAGIAVFELTPAGNDLEHQFFELIEERP
jgi:ABC-2 type transport system ATP-binding protein